MSDDALDPPTGPLVRPYAMTRGRTRARQHIALEALLSVLPRDTAAHVHGEAEAIVTLCEEVRSLAEVAALLEVPVGVARILVDDLVAEGLLIVHEPATADGAEAFFLERVLSGLRNL
ncbi:MAG: DUF742 domain-containing protein [Angustibacter sp.]